MTPLTTNERQQLKVKIRKNPIKSGNIVLDLVEVEDAEFILNLRLDADKNKFVSKVAPDLNKQIEYIKDSYDDPNQFYFIIKTLNDDKLGTIRVYDLKPNSFCWGSWIIINSRPSGTALQSAIMINNFGFNTLGFNNSHFDVRNENEKVINFHLRMGAQITDENDLDTFFIYTKETFEKFLESQ
jgi:RimJ/RimL family protein N-acetyltransferase